MDSSQAGRYGIDYKFGLKNCMEDEKFYHSILSMFLADTSFSRAKQAFEQGDYKALFNNIHELKGISGNAGLLKLYDAAKPLTELLRGECSDASEVQRMFADVEAAYQLARRGASEIVAAGI